MRYPVTLTSDVNGFVVTFLDVPEAHTQGEDRTDALQKAADALESALDFYFEDKRPVPLPSAVLDEAVALAPSVAVKVLLHNELLRQGIRPAELARRLSVPRQEVTRMLDPRHTTKIDSIANALGALGRGLNLSLS